MLDVGNAGQLRRSALDTVWGLLVLKRVEYGLGFDL